MDFGIVLIVIFQNAIPYPLLQNTLPAPAFAAIVYGFALQPRWSAFLANPLLLLLGEASYSLYLLHPFLIQLFFDNGVGDRLGNPLGLIVFWLSLIGLSILVYRYIENPARRFLNSSRPRRAASVILVNPA